MKQQGVSKAGLLFIAGLGAAIVVGAIYVAKPHLPLSAPVTLHHASTTPARSNTATTTETTTSTTSTTELQKNTVPTAPTGTLLISYKDIQPRFITDVSKDVAGGICATLFVKTCIWNSGTIAAKPYYINGAQRNEPAITTSSPQPGVTVSYGTIVPIAFSDPGPVGRHRVYLIHRNLLGEVDELHEAHIVSETGDDSGTMSWDGNEIYVNESGTEQVSQLAAGHYYLAVVNIDTGVSGITGNWIQLVTDIRGKNVPTGDLLKPYAANTPLIDSYWDGRGVFYDGNDGVDTLTMVGRRSDMAIFRGVDMPAKGQYQTLVIFRRTDGVVVVTTNVEKIKFDDQTVNTSDLIKQLGVNPANELTVPGMSTYTDPDFGFSFWYPSAWTVTKEARNVSGYGTAGIQNSLLITSDAPGHPLQLQLDEVYSPNRYVDVATAKSGLSEVYLFDTNTHTWMYSSNFNKPATTKPADVSDNTMGGLHMLYSSGSYGQQIAVPLSATHFVITPTTPYNTVSLLRTIVAADPLVATPVSQAQQKALIESERNDYTGQ